MKALNKPLNNGQKTGDGKFAPGNTYGQGRPKESRNKASLIAETMLDSEAEALTKKAIELALEGDITALRLCLDRLLPPRKERPIVFDVPEIKSIEDVANARASILAALPSKEITANERSFSY
jgi:hypothetical protein